MKFRAVAQCDIVSLVEELVLEMETWAPESHLDVIFRPRLSTHLT